MNNMTSIWLILLVEAVVFALLWNAGFVLIVQPIGSGKLLIGTVLWLANTIFSFAGGMIAALLFAKFIGIDLTDLY